MDESGRDCGGVVVRVNPLAIAEKYSGLGDERDMQATLAAELRSCGWTIIREAYCRPASGKWRRIDLHCTAPAWFGMWHRRASAGEVWRAPVRDGFVLGIECKFKKGTSKEIDAYHQCRRYVTATVWADEHGTPLARPDWFATCGINDLSGRSWRGSSRVWRLPNEYARRVMWRDGSDIMHRKKDGSLYVSVRVPRVVESQSRKIMTTADMEIPLTPWSNDERLFSPGDSP